MINLLSKTVIWLADNLYIMRRANNTYGVSSVVGNVLLVAIVFIAASFFATLILTTEFNPEPNASVDIEQTTECLPDGKLNCNTTITVTQTPNADYVVVQYVPPDGTGPVFNSIDYGNTTADLNGQSKTGFDDVPDYNNESSSLNVDKEGDILINSGDQLKVRSRLGVQFRIYAAVDGYEAVVDSYTVRENRQRFDP